LPGSRRTSSSRRRNGRRGEADRLRESLAVLGPHYAAAAVGHDLGDTGPDRERRFEFVRTFDRELVVDVAATLIARVSGSPEPSAPIG
jgi:hypothetical protein